MVKRVSLFFIFFIVVTFVIKSQETISSQRKFAKDIYHSMLAQGYDAEQSGRYVHFVSDGMKYSVYVDSLEEFPFYIELYTLSYYTSEVYTKENIRRIQSKLNRQKGLKVVCYDSFCCYKTPMFVAEARHFTSVLPKLINIINGSKAEVKKMLDVIGSNSSESYTALNRANIVSLSSDSSMSKAFDEAYKLYQSRKYEKAIPVFKELADKGYGRAIAYMGVAYEYGLHYPKDERMAMQYYRKVMEANVEQWVGFRMGNIEYQNGNYTQALKYYKYTTTDSSSGWFDDACERIGFMYEKGQGTPPDIKMAGKYYKEAALCGNKSAILAAQRLNITIYTRSDFKALSPSLTAKLSSEDLVNKGDDHCWYFQYNLPLAYGYYLAACERGYVPAYEKMGDLCSDTMFPKTKNEEPEQWYRKALDYYMKNAEDDAEAAYKSGYYHQYGMGVEKHTALAMKYYRLAASKEYGAAFWRIGVLLDEQGDHRHAFEYLLKGAQYGFCYSMMLVAKYYERGIGCKRDINQAIYWYKRANSKRYATQTAAQNALKRLGVDVVDSDEK